MGKDKNDSKEGVLENYQPDIDNQEQDPDMLLYAAEAVGYDNREAQWSSYRSITNFIDEGDSVLDFGCGRGDYKLFYSDDYKHDINYIGIDMNQNLINAGLEVYENKVNLICTDWFTLDEKIKMDWSINVKSNNLRYDADIKTSDEDYLKNTIQSMYNHSNKGVIILLDGNVHNPGNIFNWAQDSFGSTAIDHSFSDNEYVLVIYK